MKKLLILIIVCFLCLQCKNEKEQPEDNIQNNVQEATIEITEDIKADLIAQLEAMMLIDQKYAGLPPQEMFDTYGNEKAWELHYKKRDSVGLANQEKVKELYNTYGYLGYKEVGEEASGDFWLIIQHADNDIEFQKEMLQALKTEIENNNASKRNYAMLEDRVNVNLNKPQRFGSQVTYNDLGQAIPKIGLADSTNVEALRKAFDMPSFKEYYNNMTIGHFEMNKQYLKEKGISEPILYK